jgi:uncharacterized protein (DUF927 family)
MTQEAFAPLSNEEKDNPVPLSSEQEDWEQVIPVPKAVKDPHFLHHIYGKAKVVYPYKGKEGELFGYICRFETPEGKEILPCTYRKNKEGKTGWKWKGFGGARPLYNLDKITSLSNAIIIVVEGEKCAGVLSSILSEKYVVTTSIGGSNGYTRSDWSPLQDRDVTIWPDADIPGYAYAKAVGELAYKHHCKTVRQIEIPQGKPEGWDVVDAIEEGYSVDNIESLIADAKPVEIKTPMPSGFGISNGVLTFQDLNSEEPSVKICSAIEVLASTRNDKGGNWGLLLRWKDADGTTHQWAMPMEMLSGDGSDIMSYLLDQGVVPHGRSSKKHVKEYLEFCRPIRRAISTEKVGWYRNYFVFPDTVIPKSQDIFLQGESFNNHPYEVKGTLEKWQEEIALYAEGNTRLILALCIAFAPPLLNISGGENGGFHFKGTSSVGKSTVLLVAGSVWGGGKTPYIQQWRATSNALESMAEMHNDSLLCLDELGQVDGKDADNIAYMLANGQGKKRMKDKGGLRDSSYWQCLILSTGEISLSEKIAEANKRTHAGTENRFIEIPADTGRYGIFENLHNFQSGDELSRHLEAVAKECYGIPIREFLHRISPTSHENLAKNIAQIIADFKKRFVPENADGQVQRAAGRFGLVASAGILASRTYILLLSDDEIFDAIGDCFNAWLTNRGTSGKLETHQGVQAVIRFFEQFAMNRFSTIGVVNEEVDEKEKIFNRAGYKKKNCYGEWEYWVFPEVFRKEICAGYNPTDVSAELVKQGLLLLSNEGERTISQRLPKAEGGKLKRMYCFSSAIMGDTHKEREK